MCECLKQNVEMKALSSMKTGGIAKAAYFPETAEQLIGTVKQLASNNERHFVLGNLSNVLLPDGCIPFVPVVTTGCAAVSTHINDDGTVSVVAECGASLTKLAFDMCQKGYTGLEFGYGIPGTVGGAVFMNAGAYGSEMKNVISSVAFYNSDTDTVEHYTGEECRFDYRKSVFSEKNGVILSAEMVLTPDNAEACVARAKELMQKRISKQPLEYPSCGSAFKRPEGYFAGELIEKCGLKGFSVGGACVSEKHAGFVINKGGATTHDVVQLLNEVQTRVKKTFGVTLEAEIRVLQ